MTSEKSVPVGVKDQPLSELMTPAAFGTLFWRAKFLRESPFLAHLPFLFWLIDVTRPQVFVQLGLETGAGYFAACQAVDKLNLDTRCWGSETWAADDEDAAKRFTAVAEYNAETYDRFSTIGKTAPDKAFSRFAKNTIDMLVMDGEFTDPVLDIIQDKLSYRMSKQGVILIHGVKKRLTGDRGQEFVSHLSECPTVRFDAGDGLLVVLFGPEVDNRLQRLAALQPGDAGYSGIHGAFRALGQSQALEVRSGAAERKVSALTAKLQDAEDSLKGMTGERDGAREKYGALMAAYDERNPKIYELQTLAFDLRTREGELLRERDALREELHALKLETMSAASRARDETESELSALRLRLDTLGDEHDLALARATGAETASQTAQAEAHARETELRAEIEALRRAETEARAESERARIAADTLREAGAAREAELALRCEALQRTADMARQTTQQVIDTAQADLALLRTAQAAHDAEVRAEADAVRQTARTAQDEAARALDDMRSEIAGLRRRHDEVMEAATRAAEDAQRAHAALEAQAATLRAENEDLHRQLVTNLESARAAQDKADAERAHLLDETTGREAALLADIATAALAHQDAESQLTAEIHDLRSALESLQQAHAQALSDMAEAVETSTLRETGLTDVIAALEFENSDLRRNVEVRFGELVELTARFEVQKEQAAGLGAELAAVVEREAELRETLAVTEKNLHDAGEMTVAASRREIELTETVRALTLEADDLARNLDVRFGEIAELTVHVEASKTQLAELEARLATAAAHETKLADVVQTLAVENDALKRSLDVRFGEIAELTQHMEAGDGRSTELRSELDATHRREADLAAESEALRHELEALTAALDAAEANAIESGPVDNALVSGLAIENDALKRSLDLRFEELAKLTALLETQPETVETERPTPPPPAPVIMTREDGDYARLRKTVEELQQKVKAKDEIIAELEIPTWKENAQVSAERTQSFQLYGFCLVD